MRMRSIANALGFGLVALTLSGCSIFGPKPVEISTTPVDKPILVLAKPDELNLRNVEWIIITEDNYKQVIEDARKANRAISFFALTAKGYENLGLNISDIRAYIEQQKAMIAAYEKYYQESQNALDNAVKID